MQETGASSTFFPIGKKSPEKIQQAYLDRDGDRGGGLAVNIDLDDRVIPTIIDHNIKKRPIIDQQQMMIDIS